MPSDDFSGEIVDDQDESEFVFELHLSDKQMLQLEELDIYMEEFDHDLYYLLEKIGQRIDVRRIKTWVNNVMINDKNE